MDEIAIIEVNEILKLCNAHRLTESEITRLTKAGNNPVDLCGYHDTSATVLGWRSVYDTDTTQQLDLLVEIATADGCTITRPPAKIPQVDIPIFAGGIL